MLIFKSFRGKWILGPTKKKCSRKKIYLHQFLKLRAQLCVNTPLFSDEWEKFINNDGTNISQSIKEPIHEQYY